MTPSSVQLSRARNYQRKLTSEAVDKVNVESSQSSEAVNDVRHPRDASRTVESLSQSAVKSLQERLVNGTQQQLGQKVLI